MHVTFHLGAHCTDEDQLIKSLLKNSSLLSKRNVAVPGPSKYRRLLPDVLVKLQGAKADHETQEMLLESFVDQDDAEHLILGHDNFLGALRRAFEDRQFYPLAARNTTWQRNLFPDHQVTFSIGLRNPASFVPAVLGRMSPDDAQTAASQLDAGSLYWSTVLKGIRAANPDANVIAWRDEDTPLIWPDVLRTVSGVPADTQLKGGLDVLSHIMKPEGMQRLQAYTRSHPIKNELQRQRVLTAFLEKFSLPEKVEDEIDMPGWTEAYVEGLTRAYERDMDEISQIPGVILIT